MKKLLLIAFVTLSLTNTSFSQNQDSAWIVNNYYKLEKMIPMRDGIKLFTSIYIPKDSSSVHPIMMTRTPYSCAPYGSTKFKPFWERNTKIYLKEKYIVVVQDVRGRYMSEGVYEDIRPLCPTSEGVRYSSSSESSDHSLPIRDGENKTKSGNKEKPKVLPNGEDLGGVRCIDEATDTYDAIDWLVKNIPTNNGNVGVSGISYPGFYSTMAALSGHPALKAVSPQAPVTNWFIGDDVHHNGAFFVMDCFDFDYQFGVPRPKPLTEYGNEFKYPTPDNYNFFLREGTLKNLTEHYMGDTMKFWNETMNHPNYDDFWKAHTVTYSLYNVKPAMLITGGLFDAEDLWGTWNTYKTIEKQSPATNNKICVGPWFHGGWARGDGSKLGNILFGTKTSEYYYQAIELPFFNHYLNPKAVSIDGKSFFPELNLAEATVFFTGENNWKKISEWPPKNIEAKTLYLNEQGALRFTKPVTLYSYDEYVSDPAHPVPYTEDVHISRTREYMCDDQRFASRRTDVLTFKTEILKEDITLAGPVVADLIVSISTTDADFVVKLIDVFPDEYPVPKGSNTVDSLAPFRAGGNSYPMGGYQMLVRGEIIRGKFRNSFEKPEPFSPHQITEVKYELPDVAHTFLKGHRIMVQIQSSWFPLADRNPQQFVDIYKCDEKDFIKSNIKVHHDAKNASLLLLPVLKK